MNRGRKLNPHANDQVQMLKLADGRLLAYAIYGDPQGRPLYYFHGFPGSRLQAAFHHEAAQQAAVCLVAPERPGFGHSEFAARRSILSWAEDQRQLADHLGHARFGVLGVSCGGPYALACAHQLGSRLDYTGLAAGMGPMDVPEIRKGQLGVIGKMFSAARLHPWLVAPMLGLDALMLRKHPERALKTIIGLLTPPDQRLLAADAQLRAEFGGFMAEAYRQGIRAARHEAHLIGSARGFALQDIRTTVHVYQGAQDRHVPEAMGRYLAAQIRGSQFHFYPDEGHLSLIIHRFDDILRDFAASMRA